MFEDWVEYNLCPILGDYSKGQARSVVLMDNALTHMSQKVINMIEAKGAQILFAAPFSPDLNPIEHYFSVYKRYLKKHNDDMISNWEKVHHEALGSVDRDMGIKYFRKCDIPGAKQMLTTEEIHNLNNELAAVIIIIMLLQGYFQ